MFNYRFIVGTKCNRNQAVCAFNKPGGYNILSSWKYFVVEFNIKATKGKKKNAVLWKQWRSDGATVGSVHTH